MNKKMKTTIVAGVAALGIATAGVSWALFSQSATANAVGGEGGKLKPVTVSSATYKYDNATTTSPGALYPGHKAHVVITVTNPNDIAVKVNDVVPAASNPVAVTGSTPAGCATNLVPATNPTFVPADIVIQPDASAEFTLTDAIELTDAEDRAECQGMKFKTSWTVSVVNQ